MTLLRHFHAHGAGKRLVRVVCALALLFAPLFCTAQEIRVSVLGLFHPVDLVLAPADHAVMVAQALPSGASHRVVLNGEPGHRRLTFHVRGERVDAESFGASQWEVTARDGGPAWFELEVPGKLRRTYRGKLLVEARDGHLEAVVAMDVETAVASIVNAEMDEAAPLEALKAQAVVTRSFLLAGQRHLDFDFCDTTHCQFLKAPPARGSRAWSAVDATRAVVLSYRGRTLAAMYSGRCGGRTRSLCEAGYPAPAEDSGQYPYYAVECRWCREHPFVWQRHLDNAQPPPPPGDEPRRIQAVRQWGWSSLPGADFSTAADPQGWRIEGHNVGHGIGMCQYGAIGMANEGADFRRILAAFYPNTSLRGF
jgi:stage II sporulation protein D